MRFGPTRLQVSTVLAKGLRRPKLRADLRISEQRVHGKKNFVIKVPETTSYSRYGEYEYELLTMCDGTRTPAEIAAEMSERHPEKPLEERAVLEFFDGMEPGMWERSLGEKNLAVLEKIRDERKSRLNQSNILQITFKAWDPDKTLARMDPYFSWLFTREFVIFSLVLFGLIAIIWTADWARISQDTAAFYNLTQQSISSIVAFWVLLFVIGGIHELAHGLSCKHFGGEVHQMGFMLIYFSPAFYTDTTDVYLFDRTSRREWVIFSGLWIELVICGFATLVWYFSIPGSLVSDAAYKVLLFSGVSGIVINLNPFIKADGYYALSQYLRMESLREESFDFLRTWARRYILRKDIELPTTTQRQRRIYVGFGIGAMLYSTALLIFAAVWLRDFFTSHFGAWGYPFAALAIFFILRNEIQKVIPPARAWLRKKKEEFMKWKMSRGQQAAAAVAAFLLFVPPVPFRVSTDFILEPGQRAEVRAIVPGQVSEVRVRQGDSVSAGAVLAVLHNPEIEARAAILTQELALAEGRLRTAEMGGDSVQIAKSTHERQGLQEDLTVARRRLAGLVLRAPFAGVVTSANVEQRQGEYLSEGEEFTSLANRNTMRARILVHDWELQDVHPNASARLKVNAYPFRTFTGRVEKILPAAAADRPVSDPKKLEKNGQELTNYIAVELEFPNSDGSLREGMTGTAKISAPWRSLAWLASRSAWRWLRSQIW